VDVVGAPENQTVVLPSSALKTLVGILDLAHFPTEALADFDIQA
jgi:hypothetical protein